MNTSEYLSIIDNIKSEIKAAHYRAAVHANVDCACNYWSWMDMRNFSECVRKYSLATGHMWKPKRQHTISDVCTDLGFREEMIILLTRH